MTTLWDTYMSSHQDAVSRAVVRLEANGFAIDTEYCREAAQKARGDEQTVLVGLHQWLQNLGVDEPRERADEVWSSPQKTIRLFHEMLGLPPSPVRFKGRVRLDKGDRSVDVKAVEWIAGHTRDREVRRGLTLLLDLRKIRSSVKYLEKFPKFVGADGLVHPICGPAGDDDAATGPVTWRLAYKKPEGQQIPKSKKKDRYGVRRAIIPSIRGNVLTSNDYTALEVCLLAHVCIVLFGDDSLAESLLPGAPDFHATNAREVFGRHLGWSVPDEQAYSLLSPPIGTPVTGLDLGAFKGENEHPYASYLRDMGKEVWYGLQYRKGAFGFGWSLQDTQGDPIGEAAAGRVVRAMYATVPALERFHAAIDEMVLRDGGIAGFNGAWCDLSNLVCGDKMSLAKANRRGSNYPMQEGGAAVMGPAMVNVLANRELASLGWVLRMQVHDQLVGECPEANAVRACRIVKHEMENAYPLTVPLQASMALGPTLYDCKDFT